jgi:hypothetical protein
MINATLLGGKLLTRKFPTKHLFLLQKQRSTLVKRRWQSTKDSAKPADKETLKTAWPFSIRDFVDGTPIITRSFPYFGRIHIDFGTFMMNFGAITSLTGFMMTDVLLLRSLSIVGSLCGVVYNISRVPKQLNAVAWGCIFISVNLTRIVQLMLERREIHFSVEEAEVFYRNFEKHGVEPVVFKRLLKQAEWSSIDPGEEVVSSGKPLNRVIILVEGSAVVYEGSSGKRLYSYTSTDNGCIIGATAIVDPSIIGRVYPNRIVAEEKVRTLSFKTKELRNFFSNENGAPVEAALLHLIYVDLIGSLRRHRQEESPNGQDEKKVTDSQSSGLATALHELKEILMHDRRRIREHMEKHKISDAQFKALLQSKEVTGPRKNRKMTRRRGGILPSSTEERG